MYQALLGVISLMKITENSSDRNAIVPAYHELLDPSHNVQNTIGIETTPLPVIIGAK